MEEAVAVDCLKTLVPQDELPPVLFLQLKHHDVDVVVVVVGGGGGGGGGGGDDDDDVDVVDEEVRMY